MKKLLQQVLLASFAMLCGQAFAAQAVDTPGKNNVLKTGTYRICHGSVDECRKGKGILGGDYLDFEKNSTGRYTFKYEETGFLWSQDGNTLTITVDDEGEHKAEVLDGSRMLIDSQGKSPMPYVLVEDEDTVFKPGAYIECDKSAVEKCGDLVRAYLESMDEEDTDTTAGDPYAVLILFTNTEEGGESQFCPKGNSGCTPLTWEEKNNQIKVSMSGAGAKKKTFTVDNNKLIDAATGDVYQRIRNERVMKSAN